MTLLSVDDAAGGVHALCNLRPICKPCNSSKGARWPYDVRRTAC